MIHCSVLLANMEEILGEAETRDEKRRGRRIWIGRGGKIETVIVIIETTTGTGVIAGVEIMIGDISALAVTELIHHCSICTFLLGA